eukprot:6324955-Prymnesium_polylepis.1
MPSAARLFLPAGYPPPTSAPRVAAWSGAVGADTASTLDKGHKLLHFVRHAQGFHNIDQAVMKTQEGLDARLTPEGCRQCAALQQLTDGLRPQLVVSSPLTRTLQTAQRCFGPQRSIAKAPLVALEGVRET